MSRVPGQPRLYAYGGASVSPKAKRAQQHGMFCVKIAVLRQLGGE